ncbi:hypothetical protein Cni_G03036 [Canna indica]|uniref:Uncharacterized protein n=1 Tax=Canna indica TaxID=4628 RepID=A0AAQ3JSV9_9LILI|nr:hypothetical protein Cni_G03036 [Canna indica]
MALGKAAVLLLIVAAMVVEVAVAGPKEEDPTICYCPCMKDQCMILDGATREMCAVACDKGCRESGFAGQPNPYEFCGF